MKSDGTLTRDVDTVFIHCSASNHPNHDNIDTVRSWHIAKGWSDVGYHFFIRSDGTLETGRDLERTPAAQRHYNLGTVAICLHGLHVSDFTLEQFKTLRVLCVQLYDTISCDLVFRGHCEVSNKTCPVFDYTKVLKLDDSRHLRFNTLDTNKSFTIPKWWDRIREWLV